MSEGHRGTCAEMHCGHKAKSKPANPRPCVLYIPHLRVDTIRTSKNTRQSLVARCMREHPCQDHQELRHGPGKRGRGEQQVQHAREGAVEGEQDLSECGVAERRGGLAHTLPWGSCCARFVALCTAGVQGILCRVRAVLGDPRVSLGQCFGFDHQGSDRVGCDRHCFAF